MVLREEQNKTVLFKAGHKTNHIHYKFLYHHKDDSQIRRTTNKLKPQSISIIIEKNKITHAKRYR